jgi:hypothetical protein
MRPIPASPDRNDPVPGGSPQPSSLVIAGAVAMAIAPLLARAPGMGSWSWHLWAASLALVGLGLLLAGTRRWFTVLAAVAGGAFLLQLAMYLASLAGLPLAAWLYTVLAVPKVLLLMVLALAARRQVARWRRQLLLVTAALAAARTLGRELGGVPASWSAWLDPLVTALLAGALVAFAVGLRHREGEEARRRLATPTVVLGDDPPAGP